MFIGMHRRLVNVTLNDMNDIENIIKNLRDEGYIEGELSVDPLWYAIWEPENIEEYNQDYKIKEYAPGFIAFGSNGGGELLVINEQGVVYSLPAVGMAPEYAEKIAESIEDLKQYMVKDI